MTICYYGCAMLTRDERIQRAHYAEIADSCDGLHVDSEHVVGLSLLDGMLGYLKAESVLDVGAGTGRAMCFLRQCRPELRVMGWSRSRPSARSVTRRESLTTT